MVSLLPACLAYIQKNETVRDQLPFVQKLLVIKMLNLNSPLVTDHPYLVDFGESFAYQLFLSCRIFHNSRVQPFQFRLEYME